MAGLQIPMKSSGSSGSSGLKMLNQSAAFSSIYPYQGYSGYVGLAPGFSQLGTVNTSIAQTIALNTNLETVGSTQINGYFRNAVADFQILGNYFTNADYGANAELAVGWSGIAGGATNTAQTWSNAIRIASIEKLAAGKSIGANFMFCPAYKISNDNGNGPDSYNAAISNIVVTAVLRLMNAAGTLTTIGTLTTNAKAYTTTARGTFYVFDQVYSASFTPATSAAGDRIVIDITLSASVAAGGATGGGIARTFSLAAAFGFEGSKRQVLSDYLAHRPFQISIT